MGHASNHLVTQLVQNAPSQLGHENLFVGSGLSKQILHVFWSELRTLMTRCAVAREEVNSS